MVIPGIDDDGNKRAVALLLLTGIASIFLIDGLKSVCAFGFTFKSVSIGWANPSSLFSNHWY